MCKPVAFPAIGQMALLIAVWSIVSTNTAFAQAGAWTSKTRMPTARSALTSAVIDGKKRFRALEATDLRQPGK
jgi:hypothetical protein